MEQGIERGAFPASGHDHAGCVADALGRAEALCRARGVRLTPRRRGVLAIVWESHAPIGAYDILERLNADGGRNAPSVVYRALDFLIGQGFVHRIASHNAYVGCGFPGAPHPAQFLICTDCGAVAELHDPRIGRAIRASAAAAGFTVARPLVEVQGTCPGCRDGGEDGDRTAG